MISYLRKHIIWVLIFSLLLIAIFFSLGLFIRDYPLFRIDRQIKLTEVLNLSFTLLLALLIPLYIKYFIDNGIKANEMVLGEVGRYREHLDMTHQLFFSIYNSNELTENNKTEVLVLCEMLDTKFEIIQKVISQRCNNQIDKIMDELKSTQIEYWRLLTGSEIMSAKVTSIHPVTFKKESTGYANIIETLMKVNLKITNY